MMQFFDFKDAITVENEYFYIPFFIKKECKYNK